jgi:VanZ family protein
MNDMESSKQWSRVKNWLPVIVWGGLIFAFSTEIFSGSDTSGMIAPLLNKVFPSLSSDALDLIHLLVRKLGHFGEFFILAVLIMRALRNQSNESRVGLAIALTTLYAVSDELHQSVVPRRTASALDVLIDVFGGVCGTWWFRLRQHGKKAP